MNPIPNHRADLSTETLSACGCGRSGVADRRGFARRCGAAAGVALPSALLVLMPKCPACLAAYVALGTGMGLSFSTATVLRWVLLVMCIGALLFFGGRQIWPWLSRRVRERN